jgi:hypothetical protein
LVSRNDKPAYQQPIDSVTFESDRNAGKQPESIASIYAVFDRGNGKYSQELKKKPSFQLGQK